MSTDPTEVRRLVLQGLREMRRGKVGGALELWQQARARATDAGVDADNPAQAYHDYVKANRIRLAVHLGRTPPVDGQPLELPESWPAPPAGLCDPPPPLDASSEPGAAPPAPGTPTSGEQTLDASALPPETQDDAAPYVELDLHGAAPMVPREVAVNGTKPSAEESEPDDHVMHGSDEYAVLEIVVDEEEDEGPEHEQELRPTQPEAEPDSSGALPPPPEALDAPELDLEAPRASGEAREDHEPQDYVLDRSASEQIDRIGLERFAGPTETAVEGAGPPPVPSPPPTSAPPPPPASAPASPPPKREPYAEDAPTIARSPEASGPAAPAAPATPAAAGSAAPSAPEPGGPAAESDGGIGGREVGNISGVTVTLDEHGRPTISEADLPPGVSPGSTLMGVGPDLERLLASASEASPNPGSEPAPASPRQTAPGGTSAPTPGRDARPGAAPPEAAPAAETEKATAAPAAPERSRAGDYASTEGSFSDDLPTRARPVGAPSADRSGAFIRPMPHSQASDYASTEGSFSDDLPTRARSYDDPAPAPSAAATATPPPSPAPPSETGPSGGHGSPEARAPDPGAPDPGAPDYGTTEGSFSEDLPTRTREATDETPSGFRPLPYGEGTPVPSASPPVDPEDQVTLERQSSGPPPQVDDELEALLDPEAGLATAQRLHRAGKHEKSLALAEKLAERYPQLGLDGLETLIADNQQALEGVFVERLGSLNAIPMPQAGAERLDSLELDPRAVFLFTRIDGTLSLEDLLDISGMSRFETARLLLRLRELGLLRFEPGRG